MADKLPNEKQLFLCLDGFCDRTQVEKEGSVFKKKILDSVMNPLSMFTESAWIHREWKHPGQGIQCIRDSSLSLEAGEKSLIAIYIEIHS